MQKLYPDRIVEKIYGYKDTYIAMAPLKEGQPFGTGACFILEDDKMLQFNPMPDLKGWREAIHKEPLYKRK